jgi:hypothetical protein
LKPSVNCAELEHAGQVEALLQFIAVLAVQFDAVVRFLGIAAVVDVLSTEGEDQAVVPRLATFLPIGGTIEHGDPAHGTETTAPPSWSGSLGSC